MLTPTLTTLLEPEIILVQDIHVSRKKVKENELVDRGIVSLKVVRDTTGRSFRFIGQLLNIV